jgi:2,3-bisphosphoglycerate-dependent phosphoglycerate mutase
MTENACRLVLLRHGASQWNEAGRFTGWVDVPLSAAGEQEARDARDLMMRHGLVPGAVYTSTLARAVRTADVMLDGVWEHTVRDCSWRLNERHYGLLEGRSKTAVRAEFGDDLYMKWRRSYWARPPAGPVSPGAGAAPPAAESLADVVARLLPYWEGTMAAGVREHGTVLVVGHSNSLRALIKIIDRMDDDEVARLNVPTGIPLLFELDAGLRPFRPGGRYLDEGRARRAISKVKREGFESLADGGLS